MKCPRCDSDQTRLSWLQEFKVVYWCANCHTGFDVSRHRSRTSNPSRQVAAVEPVAVANGTSELPSP
jgi:hypothetical protein